MFEEGSVRRDRTHNTPDDDRARAVANFAHANLFPVRCGVESIGNQHPGVVGIYTNVGWCRPDGSDSLHELLKRPEAPWHWLGYDTDNTGYSAATIVRLTGTEAEAYH